ncbi:hypothetical protein MY3296_006933 [Beauveria thailandica]
MPSAATRYEDLFSVPVDEESREKVFVTLDRHVGGDEDGYAGQVLPALMQAARAWM